MGFADYLSRHPSSTLVPTSEDDEKFVINLIQELKHAIQKQDITLLGSTKPTGNFSQSENNTQNERNDVTHDKRNTRSKESAFCHINSKNNLLHSSQSLLTQIQTKLIAITTRSNLLVWN